MSTNVNQTRFAHPRCEHGGAQGYCAICRANCEHDYQTVYEDWNSETLQCSKCGDRYKLYDDEMR